tara:strand:- start:62 stop:268 length:207 start_codon:yes stop_codon:yes gene_type:complete
MASLPGGFAGRSACRIYLGLVKENFLHERAGQCRAIAGKLAMQPGKTFFLQTWVGGVALPYTSSYIYT